MLEIEDAYRGELLRSSSGLDDSNMVVVVVVVVTTIGKSASEQILEMYHIK